MFIVMIPTIPGLFLLLLLLNYYFVIGKHFDMHAPHQHTKSGFEKSGYGPEQLNGNLSDIFQQAEWADSL